MLDMQNVRKNGTEASHTRLSHSVQSCTAVGSSTWFSYLLEVLRGMKRHFEEHRLLKKQKLVAEQAQPNLWDPRTKSWIRPQKTWV